MTTPFDLNEKQRAAGRLVSRQRRAERAGIRKKLASGSYTITDLFDRADKDDAAVKRMRVLPVLTALPGVGKITAAKIMDVVEISEKRRIGGLGRKQREALVAELSRRGVKC